MLYNLAAGLLFGGALLSAYRMGLRDGMTRAEKRMPAPPFAAPPFAARRPQKAPAKPDPFEVILGNINRYDGTDTGQEEVL